MFPVFILPPWTKHRCINTIRTWHVIFLIPVWSLAFLALIIIARELFTILADTARTYWSSFFGFLLILLLMVSDYYFLGRILVLLLLILSCLRWWLKFHILSTWDWFILDSAALEWLFCLETKLPIFDIFQNSHSSLWIDLTYSCISSGDNGWGLLKWINSFYNKSFSFLSTVFSISNFTKWCR